MFEGNLLWIYLANCVDLDRGEIMMDIFSNA